MHQMQFFRSFEWNYHEHSNDSLDKKATKEKINITQRDRISHVRLKWILLLKFYPTHLFAFCNILFLLFFQLRQKFNGYCLVPRCAAHEKTFYSRFRIKFHAIQNHREIIIFWLFIKIDANGLCSFFLTRNFD